MKNNDNKCVNQPGYDLIGDIHGYAGNLYLLLGLLGYDNRQGPFKHPKGRKVIFLGDYIDRGPEIRETLQIVKGMVDSGNALAIMGNHEFNALAYHTPDGKGGYLRPHTEEKMAQHSATLEQIVQKDPEEWAMWLEWFSRLPLFLDLGDLRAVHAAWDDQAIEAFKGIECLNGEILLEMATKKTPLNKFKEIVLNGQELDLPEGYVFSDKTGFSRKQIRTRWWMPMAGKTYRDVVFPDCDTVPRIPIPDLKDQASYASDAPPVFIGHYWLPDGSSIEPLEPNIACLDYSVAKGGGLTAYAWDGESALSADKFYNTKHRCEVRVYKLSAVERERLVAKALTLPGNEGLNKEFMEGFDDNALRVFADDLSEEERAESERDIDSEDWTEFNNSISKERNSFLNKPVDNLPGKTSGEV